MFSKYKKILTDSGQKFLFQNLIHHIVGMDNVVSIVTRCGLDGLGVNCR
jgi:hypothetical protein